jgi:hypothetical protein
MTDTTFMNDLDRRITRVQQGENLDGPLVAFFVSCRC